MVCSRSPLRPPRPPPPMPAALRGRAPREPPEREPAAAGAAATCAAATCCCRRGDLRRCQEHLAARAGGCRRGGRPCGRASRHSRRGRARWRCPSDPSSRWRAPGRTRCVRARGSTAAADSACHACGTRTAGHAGSTHGGTGRHARARGGRDRRRDGGPAGVVGDTGLRGAGDVGRGREAGVLGVGSVGIGPPGIGSFGSGSVAVARLRLAWLRLARLRLAWLRVGGTLGSLGPGTPPPPPRPRWAPGAGQERTTGAGRHVRRRLGRVLLAVDRLHGRDRAEEGGVHLPGQGERPGLLLVEGVLPAGALALSGLRGRGLGVDLVGGGGTPGVPAGGW